MFITKLLKGIVAILGGIIFALGCIAAFVLALACVIPVILICLLLFAGAALVSVCGVDILDGAVDKAAKDLKSGIIDDIKDIE